MGIKYIIVCDRCKNEEQRTPGTLETFRTIKLSSQASNVARLPYGGDILLEATYCEACVDALGLTPALRKKAEEQAAKDAQAAALPTLEDIIRELVQDEIAISQG